MSNCIPNIIPYAAAAGTAALIAKGCKLSGTGIAISALGGAAAAVLCNAYVIGIGGVMGHPLDLFCLADKPVAALPQSGFGAYRL